MKRTMTKVYPNTSFDSNINLSSSDRDTEFLTVWNKSLLFNCRGYTVYNSSGNLKFRVDNYMAPIKGDNIVLMDAGGSALLTVRRKKVLNLSLADSWLIFNGEMATSPLYSVRKLRGNKTLAQVISSKTNKVVYEMEGSYTQRCCTVLDGKRRKVAEITRKEGVGMDVFRLIVHPEIDTARAMALVILLDQMFGSSS